MTSSASRLIPFTLTLALLGGCATSAVQPSSPALNAALVQLESGQPREAAVALEALASQSRGAAKTTALADAAWAWQLAGDSVRARDLLNSLNPRHLSGATAQRMQLLRAELALQDNQSILALSLLSPLPAPIHTPLQTRWLLMLAQAQEASGNPLAAAHSRTQLRQALPPSEQASQREAITRLLASVDDTTLRSHAATLPPGDALYNPIARALLARGIALPRPLDMDAGSLPDISARAAASPDGYRPPTHIAVLLPLSGPLATAASPVRDGLLAAYYAEGRKRPALDFIDTRGTPAGALNAYDRAVAAGADYVIGPLDRESVDALFARKNLPVPIQALNYGHTLPPQGHLAFSLAPEDDGVMAAEYLLARKQTRAAILHSNDDNGRRSAAAFQRHFNERGGQITQTIAVNDSPSGLPGNLGDTEAMFLAVRGPQARTLMSQFPAAGLGQTTRVASSQLTSGTGKAVEDRALDGIAFPTERWPSQAIAGLPAGQQLEPLLPTARGAAARLLAFGADAWRISAYPERLAGSAGTGLEGATGLLYLDGDGRVVRRPVWSTFRSGHASPLRDTH